MTVEAAGFIDDIDPTQPPGTDNFSEGDNHLRNFKKSVQDSLPNISGAMTATHTELNNLDGYTGNTADLNILSGADTAGLTAAELQYVKGVTSDIQTQMDEKETYVQSVTGTVAASALTAGLGAGSLNFRNSTLTSGAATANTNTVLSLIAPNGATLGTTDAVESDLILLAIDNAGTSELAIVNNSGTVSLDEKALISTTAIGTGSDSADVVYSTTARSNVAFRVVGLIRSTQATAGVWDTSPSLLQGWGGTALIGSSLGDLASVDDVTEAEMDWPNNAGISNFIKSGEGFATYDVQTLTDIGDYYVFIPASANSIQYYMEMEATGTSTAPQCRINTSTNNGTTLSASNTTKQWVSVGTLNISNKSGWTLITAQGGYVGGPGGSAVGELYNICMRFI